MTNAVVLVTGSKMALKVSLVADKHIRIQFAPKINGRKKLCMVIRPGNWPSLVRTLPETSNYQAETRCYQKKRRFSCFWRLLHTTVQLCYL